MMKSLFSQFTPDTLMFLPLQILASSIAMLWLIMLYPTKFFSGHITYLWNQMRLEAFKLMFQKVKKKSAPWMSSLSAMFFLILSINLLGLFPYTFTITSHVSFTYSMAMPLWLSVKMLGFYLAFKSRLSHLVPQGTPPFLIPLMVWMETMSLIAQPIALGLRLAANLTAGHLLLFLFSSAAWVLSKNLMLSSMTMIVLILMFMLEMGVACIQAYVFTSLMNFYLDQNI